MQEPHDLSEETIAELTALIGRVRWPYASAATPSPEDLYGKPHHRLGLMLASRQMQNGLEIELPEGPVTIFLHEGLCSDENATRGILVDIVSGATALCGQSRLTLINAVRSHAARRNWAGVTALLFVAESQLLLPARNQGVTSRVRKPVIILERPAAKPPVEIRLARPEDEPKCLFMIESALSIGLRWNMGGDPDPQQVQNTARFLLADIHGPNGLHLVATQDGMVVGHALGLKAKECLRTGICDGVLFDAFTLKAFRNQGISELLTDAWEFELGRRGGRSFRGTVSGPNRLAILEKLATRGWQEFALEWQVT